MEQIKRQQSKQEAIEEQEGPIVHQTEEPAEETADIGILTDFLVLVAECEDADDLTARVEQANAFEGIAQKTAKKAIMDRSKELGLRWDSNANEFKKKGGA